MTVGEHLLTLFEKICVNEFNTYVWEDDFGNKLRMTYENKDLDNLCVEALFRGERHFYARKEMGDITEPEYVYVLTRPLTPEEYDDIARCIQIRSDYYIEKED